VLKVKNDILNNWNHGSDSLRGFLNWWGKQPAKHRVNIAEGDFRNYVEALLYRGYDLGFMIVEAPDRKRFIQFTKYIKRKSR